MKQALEGKIVVLGAQGVGKTSLVAKYISNVYSKEIGPTIGASFFTCKVNLNEFKVKMQIWDTAGQERFKAMAPMYYRNANAALLVFDITYYNSFLEVKTWIQELQRNVQEPMFLLVVGNKIDLEERRAVSREEAFIYAQSIGAKYIETSVVKDQGIEQVFLTIGLGLINLSNETTTSTLKRYESYDSILSSAHSTQNLSDDGLLNGISIDNDSGIVVNGEYGRLETPNGWAREAVAHAEIQKTGWCC